MQTNLKQLTAHTDAFLCFAVGGVYAACPLTLMWVANSIPHPSEKRGIAIAIVNSLGNTASIYGSFLWPSSYVELL